MKTLFNTKRFGWLFIGDLIVQIRTGLIALGAVFGLLVLTHLLYHGGESMQEFHNNFYRAVLLIGGMVVTSGMFTELNDPRSAVSYLMLPASALEKFLSRFLISSIAVIVATAIVYNAASIGGSLIVLVFGYGFHPVFVNPVSAANLSFLRLYMVFHAVMLFGALFFRKHALIKTILTLFVVAIVYGLAALLFARIFFANQFDGMSFSVEQSEFTNVGQPGAAYVQNVAQLIQFAFNWLLAPYFWVLAYLRLRETEV